MAYKSTGRHSEYEMLPEVISSKMSPSKTHEANMAKNACCIHV